MSGKTIHATRLPDGTLVEELSDGSVRPFLDPLDEDPMTDEEIEAAALSDPDAQQLTEADLAQMKPVARVKIIRRALGLTREEFSARYRIPLAMITDWERYRSYPDAVASAYLEIIAAIPESVEQAFLEQEKTASHTVPQLEKPTQRRSISPLSRQEAVLAC